MNSMINFPIILCQCFETLLNIVLNTFDNEKIFNHTHARYQHDDELVMGYVQHDRARAHAPGSTLTVLRKFLAKP